MFTMAPALSSCTIPECGIVSTSTEKTALLLALYTRARNEIIQGLTEELLSKAPGLWVCSKHLFNSETLPHSVSVAKFGMEIWKKTDNSMVVNGTEVYLGSDSSSKSDETVVLLRHKFDNGYYYYRACSLRICVSNSQQSESSEELLGLLQGLVSSAVQDYNNNQKNSSEETAEATELLETAMLTLVPNAMADVLAAKEVKVGIVPKTYTISWKEQLVTYIQC